MSNPQTASLEQQLGYQFRQPELLTLALTHPSVTHERGGEVQHNQRLEFLGDAVIQLVLTRELFDRYVGFGEGALTKARAHLVNRTTLATEAAKFDLGSHLIMSKGEEATGGRTRDSALADGFEALIGAVFLDGGFEEVQRLVRRVFAEALNIDNAIPRLNNPKGELQEMLQVTASSPPQYEMISVAGLEHDRVFECAVLHDGKELARGSGKSKKAAESMAAMEALKVLRSQTTEKPGAAG